MLNEFKNFIAKGNVMDMAVGIIIGAAFTAIVTSLVKDIINPFIGLFTGGIDFSALYINLSGEEYETLAAAHCMACKRSSVRDRLGPPSPKSLFLNDFL